jgi:Skp family chaperone for outer membrane proteins
VALLNMTYVLKHYEEFKALQDSVSKEMAFYQTRHAASLARVEAWTKELANPNLAAQTRAGLELDIRAERLKMEDTQQEAKQKIAKLTDEQTVALYRKVQETAERYARAHEIDLVLQWNDVSPDDKDYFGSANVTRRLQSGGCTPLYWKAELDISKAVVAAMNQHYRGAGR